jgi:predicted RNA-binding Zn ribbon-like protein
VELTSYADRAVALVNSVDLAHPERDQLGGVDRLRGFLAGNPTWQARAAARDLAPLRQVRARLRRVFEASTTGQEDRAVNELNALLREYPIQPQISGHDDRNWHLHLVEGAPAVASSYATGAIMGLAVFCTEYGLDRLGVCQAVPCRQVYLDTSTNRSRRYCSDRCATRANVAAYRQRRREQQAVDSAIAL